MFATNIFLDSNLLLNLKYSEMFYIFFVAVEDSKINSRESQEIRFVILDKSRVISR